MRRLAEVLAYLYPEYGAIHRVTAFAGLDTSAIDIDGAPLDVWVRVLEEETKQGLRGRMLLEAMREYPGNPLLIPAGMEYLNPPEKWERPRPDLSRRQWGVMAFAALLVIWLLVLSILAIPW